MKETKAFCVCDCLSMPRYLKECRGQILDLWICAMLDTLVGDRPKRPVILYFKWELTGASSDNACPDGHIYTQFDLFLLMLILLSSEPNR